MFSISKLARNNWLAAAFLILLCAALLLPGLGASSVSRQQELRVLLAAREMAEGGSWIVPHFMGAERLRKPPLMYWLVASAFKAAGTTESAAAARAISAAAGTAFVLATFFLGRRLIGRRAAFVGAIILATSVGFLRHARLAETDIPQALFCSLTIFSIFTALTVRTGNLKHWIFAGIFSGIGFMFKGPASVAMPIAAVATFIFVARSHRAALTLRGIIVALVICAAIAAPWYIAVALKTANTNAQAGDEINRLLTESAHKGPIFYYVWTLPARLGIWALALPVAIFGAAKKLRHHRGPLYLLCWLASSFAILSALSSKQNHYALLLFAPSALLTGWLLAEAARKLPIIGKDGRANFQSLEKTKPRRDFCSGFARVYLIALCLIALVAGFLIFAAWFFACPISWPRVFGWAGAFVSVLAAVALFRLFFRCDVIAPMVACAAVLAFATGIHALRLEQIVDADHAIVELLASNRAAIRAAPRFIISGPHNSIIAWYAHRDVAVSTNGLAATWAGMNSGDVLLCSARKQPLDVSAIPAAPFAKQPRLDVSAFLFRKDAEKNP